MKISDLKAFKLEKSDSVKGGFSQSFEEGGTFQKTWYECPDGQGEDWFKDYVD